MAEKLSIHLNREPLGTLFLHGNEDRYELEYAQSWLDGDGFSISPHLQLRACRSNAVKRFLANLLPEGKWLEELSTNHHVSKSNIFALVAAIGEETTGALTFRHTDVLPESTSPSFREVSPEELHDRVARRHQTSIALWDNKPRLSVAGIQDKLPLLVKANGEMGFGEGDLASTHLFKFGNKPEMHLVINEYICMELARMVKLPVANVALKRFGEPVLTVERFDRILTTKRVERLHLIDGCQMLDLQPTYKYERPFGLVGEGAKIRTGASLSQLFAACRQCRIPAAATRDLLHWVLFQLLIGNNDAHAKNISFFLGKKGIDVAPAYDLLNTDIYGDQYDQNLAMAIGDTFRSDDIFAFQLAKMCDTCNLPQRQVATSLKTLCQSLLKAIDTLNFAEIVNKEELSFSHTLTDSIRNKTIHFLEAAKELPAVKH